MTAFPFHTLASAPAESQSILAQAERNLGFVPSLYAGLAESPAALKAYLQLSQIMNGSSLDPVEQQIIALTASAENDCTFCMAAHSTIARTMMKIDNAIVDALREQRPLPNPHQEALRRFVQAVVRERGVVRGPVLDAFLAAGYNQRQALDVVLGVAWKTLSNYANHLLDTPTDPAFEAERWPPVG